MSEPFWTPLGGQPVDYEGAWNPATQYASGDVVRYQGVDYLAVNPSLGTTPPLAVSVAVPLVTALPASPTDGQEVIFTDSLTAGTFHWRFRYVAGRATNKWIFLGGPPRTAQVDANESRSSNVYGDLATVGPSIVVPVAGDYIVEHGNRGDGAPGWPYMSYDIGAIPASDADCTYGRWTGGSSGATGPASFRRNRKSLSAVTLVAKYKSLGEQVWFQHRWIALTPIAVGG